MGIRSAFVVFESYFHLQSTGWVKRVAFRVSSTYSYFARASRRCSAFAIARIILVLAILAFALSVYAQNTNDLSCATDSLLERRVALVVGNNKYKDQERLPELLNAIEDARQVQKELVKRCFFVISVHDATREQFIAAIDDFKKRLAADVVGLFYYAGHGMEIDGANYLIPVDVDAGRSSNIRYNSIDLNLLLEDMGQSAEGFRLAIIDACRNNAFDSQGRQAGKQRGLRIREVSGVFTIFASSAGEIALERLGNDDQSRNGLFTREFLEVMKKPGLDVRDATREVKLRVADQAKKVGHKQNPIHRDGVDAKKNFYFTPAESSPPPALSREQIEDAIWRDIKDSASAERLKNYIDRYPNGRYTALAEDRLLVLRRKSAESGQDSVQKKQERVTFSETDGVDGLDILRDRVQEKLDRKFGESWRNSRFFAVRFTRGIPYQLTGPLRKVQYRVTIEQLGEDGKNLPTLLVASGYSSAQMGNGVSDEQLKLEAMLDAISNAFKTKEGR